jgi:F-box-like
MDRILDISTESLNDPFAQLTLQTQPSYISCLPNELLLEVFHILVFGSIGPNVTPVILSHVSKLWRQLILHTPVLWTDVMVAEDLGPDVTSFLKTIHRVQFFLTHSVEHAFHLHIELRTYHSAYIMDDADHPFHDNVDQFRECTGILSTYLAPHIWRLESFILDCDEFQSICDVQCRFPVVPMKMLEFLRVHQAFEEQSFDHLLDDELELEAITLPLGPRWTADSEEMYPKLRCAILTAIPMDWGLFSPKMLHTLEISFLPLEARPDGGTLRQILLANEHSLESLTIHGAGPVDCVPVPYVMSNLRNLDLGYAFPVELIDLIRCLRVPNLATFSITDLRRSLTFVTDRRSVDYDTFVTDLFQAIIDELPLHQVKQLQVRHVCFMPELENIEMWPELQLVPNVELLPIPVTALHFLCKFTALKSLTIVDPDPGTLHALNYVPPLNRFLHQYDDLQSTYVPVPVLDFLHLADFNVPLVSFFLEIRRKYHTSFRRLLSLIFSMPAAWFVGLDSLVVLADSVQIFDTILEPAVEEELLTPFR